ncbi:MAG: hypothetical protein HYU66_26455 [Armatimonadetes bacterium]|nr:hypothetical protein [Armatimonadota bacterium]
MPVILGGRSRRSAVRDLFRRPRNAAELARLAIALAVLCFFTGLVCAGLEDGRLAGLSALAMVVWLAVAVRAQIQERDARALRWLGGGDSELGHRIHGCEQRLEQLQAELDELRDRRLGLQNAYEQLSRSTFTARAEALKPAMRLIDDQIARRYLLVEEWQGLRTDLQALVVMNSIEPLLPDPDNVVELDQMDEERQRLQDAHDELMALDEVWRELG